MQNNTAALLECERHLGEHFRASSIPEQHATGLRSQIIRLSKLRLVSEIQLHCTFGGKICYVESCISLAAGCLGSAKLEPGARFGYVVVGLRQGLSGFGHSGDPPQML